MFSIATKLRKRALLIRARNFVVAQKKGDYETEVMKDAEAKYTLEFHRNGRVLLARQKEGRITWFRPQDEVFKRWLRNIHLDLLVHKTDTRRLLRCPSRVPRPRVAPL